VYEFWGENTYSDWAANIVPIPKPNGTVCICVDYKVTVNPALIVDQYPLLSPEYFFTMLAGAKVFTKLDLSQTYPQVVLDAESRMYVMISTHKGLYQFTWLLFVIASASTLFQQLMEKILQGIPQVYVVYIDDILITGYSEQ